MGKKYVEFFLILGRIRSRISRYGSADPEPHQNQTALKRCLKHLDTLLEARAYHNNILTLKTFLPTLWCLVTKLLLCKVSQGVRLYYAGPHCL